MRLTTGLSSLLAFGLLLNTAHAADQWKVVGPGGGGTTIGPTISPHDPRQVAIHCDMTGGYLTSNNGLSWRMVNLHGGITAFAFDPVRPEVIYAANSALWQSKDNGHTWAMLFPDPADGTVEHQLGDHSDYSLTSRNPVYPGGEISAIAIAPGAKRNKSDLHDGQIYLAFEKRGEAAQIVSSEDGGAHWKTLASLPQRVLLLVPGADGLRALSGTTAYLISADGHSSPLGHLPSTFVSATAGASSGTPKLYATAANGKVYVSDGGAVWTVATPALNQSSGHFGAIAASAQHPDTAYVGFRGLQLGAGKQNLFNGIAKTANGGKTWSIVFKESDRPASNLKASWIEQRATQEGESIWFDAAYSLAVAPTDPKVAYASDLFRTYRTLDGGLTWQQVNSAEANTTNWTSRGLDVTTSYGMQFDPFDKQHIYMDNTDMGLFQSKDGGQSWMSTSEGVPEDWRNTTYWLAFDPDQKGLVWGAFSGVHDLPRPKMWRHKSPQLFTGGVGVSTDGGLHWTPSGTGMPSTSITHILLDPASKPGARTLYATAFGRGVYKSVDSGKTWTLKNQGIEGKEPFAWRLTAAKNGTLYLVVARRSEMFDVSPAGAGALYVSTDGAEHWSPLQLPAGVNGPTALEIDPRDQQRLYLTAWGQEGTDFDKNGGVYGSEDGGVTWKNLFSLMQHVYDVTIDPNNPDRLYITGFDAAAYRSLDRGAHWDRIPGFDFKWSHRIFIDPNDPSKIYINTYGGGVWHGPAEGTPREVDAIQTRVPIAH